jgi:uncharacterized protein YukE
MSDFSPRISDRYYAQFTWVERRTGPLWPGEDREAEAVMSMWGADTDELNHLSSSFRSGAGTLEEIGTSLTAHLQSTSWAGTDADTFISDWSHVHVPVLSGVANALRDLVTVLEQQAAQQTAASAAGSPTGASGSTPTSTAKQEAQSIVRDAEKTSGNVGWYVSPLLAKVKGVGALQNGDELFRGGQDLLAGHYQTGFVEGTNDAASAIMAKGGAVGFVGGVDVILGQHVEEAYRAINWSYTFHHLSQLNPLAPGALHAVYGAEAPQFQAIGTQIGQDEVGAKEGSL